MKKTLATLLTLTLLFAVSMTTFATDSTVPVSLTVEPLTFSVTVPTFLPITQTSTGDVIVASNATVTNDSAGPVVISNIATKGKNGWSTVGFEAFAPKSAKINTKDFGLSLTLGATTILTTGADSNDFGGPIRLAKGESLPMTYDAKLAAQKEATSTQIAEVIMTVGWDE